MLVSPSQMEVPPLTVIIGIVALLTVIGNPSDVLEHPWASVIVTLYAVLDEVGTYV